jgi:hypothetical protein
MPVIVFKGALILIFIVISTLAILMGRVHGRTFSVIIKSTIESMGISLSLFLYSSIIIFFERVMIAQKPPLSNSKSSP